MITPKSAVICVFILLDFSAAFDTIWPLLLSLRSQSGWPECHLLQEGFPDHLAWAPRHPCADRIVQCLCFPACLHLSAVSCSMHQTEKLEAERVVWEKRAGWPGVWPVSDPLVLGGTEQSRKKSVSQGFLSCPLGTTDPGMPEPT